MNKENKPIVISLIGAPSAGKSTTAAMLFSLMKQEGMDVELVTEYAKDLVWEMRADTMKNQIYIFGKQHQRLFRLRDKVKYIVTDCPLLLSEFYNREYNDGSEAFKNLVVQEINKFTNVNFYLNRTKKYNPKGRNQNEQESDEIGRKLLLLLEDLKMPYHRLDADKKCAKKIFKMIKKDQLFDYKKTKPVIGDYIIEPFKETTMTLYRISILNDDGSHNYYLRDNHHGHELRFTQIVLVERYLEKHFNIKPEKPKYKEYKVVSVTSIEDVVSYYIQHIDVDTGKVKGFLRDNYSYQLKFDTEELAIEYLRAYNYKF